MKLLLQKRQKLERQLPVADFVAAPREADLGTPLAVVLPGTWVDANSPPVQTCS